jgi:hypothetical protein
LLLKSAKGLSSFCSINICPILTTNTEFFSTNGFSVLARPAINTRKIKKPMTEKIINASSDAKNILKKPPI